MLRRPLQDARDDASALERADGGVPGVPHSRGAPGLWASVSQPCPASKGHLVPESHRWSKDAVRFASIVTRNYTLATRNEQRLDPPFAVFQV